MDLLGMLLDLLNGFISNIIDALIKAFVETFNFLYSQGKSSLSFPLIQNGIHYVQGLCMYILIIKLIFEGYQTYMLRQNGDPDSSVSQFLIKGAQSIAVIEVLPWIVNTIYDFGGYVAQDVMTLNGASRDVGAVMSGYGGLGGTLANAGVAIIDIIVLLLVFLIGIVMLFIVCIQIAIRSAELALMTIIGPFMALNITTNNRSIWGQWFRQVFGLCLTHALQVFMLMCTMALLASFGPTAFSTLFLFLGWLWITIKTPNFIKQFTHQTGAGALAGGAIKQATTMRIMRSFMGSR